MQKEITSLFLNIFIYRLFFAITIEFCALSASPLVFHPNAKTGESKVSLSDQEWSQIISGIQELTTNGSNQILPITKLSDDGFIELKYEFQLVRENGDLDPKTKERLIEDYFMSQIEEFRRENFELYTRMNSLQVENYKLKIELARMKNDTEQISWLKSKFLELFADEIKSGKLFEAREVLENLYDEYHEENSVKMIDFINRHFDKISETILGYRVLYDTLEDHRVLDKYPTLFLKGYVDDLINFPSFIFLEESYQKEAKDLAKNLDGPSNILLEKWRQKIINEDYEEILTVSINHFRNFRMIIKDIVNFSYENDRLIVDKLIKFASSLYGIEDAGIGYNEILKNMRNREFMEIPELLTLTQRVKECFNMKNFKTISQKYLGLFRKLKLSIPENIRNIVWNEVCIVNIENGLFLTVDSDESLILSENCEKWKFHNDFSLQNLNSSKFLTVKLQMYNNPANLEVILANTPISWNITPAYNGNLISIQLSLKNDEYLLSTHQTKMNNGKDLVKVFANRLNKTNETLHAFNSLWQVTKT